METKETDNKKEEIKVESLKNYIKNLAKDEPSLRSISFSINKEGTEIICYFTWKLEFYKKYFVERDNFRNNVKNYLSKNGYRLNIKKSSSARYVFVKGEKREVSSKDER